MNFANYKYLRTWAATFALAAFLITAVTATPYDNHKKGKHRGRNNSGHSPNRNKKNEKFINGHDARDGRVDGRGSKHKH